MVNDPVLRAKIVFALLGLVILGLGLMTAVMLAGRAVRRIVRQPSSPSRPISRRWYEKRSIPHAPADPHDEADQ